MPDFGSLMPGTNSCLDGEGTFDGAKSLADIAKDEDCCVEEVGEVGASSSL